MAGIQSLTILLSVALVISTGVIIGTLSITTGNKATDDIKETGDRGISECFRSSESTVATVSNIVLDATLEDVSSRCLALISAQERILESTATFLKGKDPDVLQTRNFKNEVLSPFLYSQLSASATDSILYLIHIPFGWSNNQSLYDDPEFGSPIAHLRQVGEGYSHHLMWDTEKGPYYPTPERETSLIIRYGSADPSGSFIRDFPGCRNLPNFAAGETQGICRYPKGIVNVASGIDAIGVHLLDATRSSGPLASADNLHYANIEGTGSDLTLRSYYVYTHPMMPNRYPRQDHRVGIIIAGQNAKIYSDMFKALPLKAETHLYCVEKDTVTGEIGKLVAVNHGTAFLTSKVDFGATQLDLIRPIKVTEHNDSDGNSSIIQQHGRFMIGDTSPGFENASKIPAHRVTPWYSNTGVQYWTQVKRIDAGSNLVWYLSMLADRDEVMKPIDESVQRIREQIESDRLKTDDDKRRAFVIMLVAVLVSAVTLLIVGVLFTKIIIKPLIILQHDMSSIAQMKLDDVDTTRKLSSLSEVKAMELSFKQMISNLLEYRNYMPQSVLIDSSELGETETSLHENDLWSHTRSHTTADQVSQDHSSRDKALAQNQLLVELVLKRKKIGITSFNVVGFHSMIMNKSEGEIYDIHQKVLTAVTTNVSLRNGICETFTGDRILATFNAVRPASSYSLSSVQAGDAARRAVQGMVVLSYACGSGSARVGNMGIRGMKKFTVLSPSVPFVASLEKLNNQFGTLGLVDHFNQESILLGMTLRKILLVTCPKRDDKVIIISEIIEPKYLADEEWMYQLRDAQSTNRSPWNNTFDALQNGNWEEADKLLVPLESLGTHEIIKRMREAVDSKTMKPLCVEVT